MSVIADPRRVPARRCGGGRFLSALLIGAASTSGLPAHVLSADRVVRELNREDVRSATGIEEARADPRSGRHLVIRVGAGWRDLPAARRAALATHWLRAWRHARPAGVVSILDAQSGEPVVNFGAAGEVSLPAGPTSVRRGAPRTRSRGTPPGSPASRPGT